MRNAWAVCKREFSEYFTTPLGYIVVSTFAAIAGLGFAASFIIYSNMSMAPGSYAQTGVPDFEENLLSPYLVFCGQLIMFLGPLITMRLLAEERNRGTMELLLTYPLRDREIIFGKFFAGLGMLLVMMLIVGAHLCQIAYYVDIEPAVLGFGLLAVFLMGAAFISMGLFVSAMASSQTTAATAAFAIWFVSYILGSFGEDISPENPAPLNWPERVREAVQFLYSLFRQFVIELPIDAHAKEMAQGVFEPRDVTYYLLVTCFFLFLTFRALESRKWRA